MLKKIKDGKIPLDPSDGMIHEFVEQLRSLRTSSDKEKRKEIKEKIKKRKEELSNNIKDSIKIPASYSYEALEYIRSKLEQLAQHHLKGKWSKEAMNIAKSIYIPGEDKINSNIIKVSRWDKSLINMPTYEEYRCCAFLGYGRPPEICRYMLNKGAQLLKIEAGDKKAMAITCGCIDEKGNKYLVVDSVESKYHIFEKGNIVRTVDKAIQEYAKKAGFDYVFYNATPGNIAPNEFYDKINEIYSDKETSGLKLDYMDKDSCIVYLEVDLDDATGIAIKVN